MPKTCASFVSRAYVSIQKDAALYACFVSCYSLIHILYIAYIVEVASGRYLSFARARAHTHTLLRVMHGGGCKRYTCLDAYINQNLNQHLDRKLNTYSGSCKRDAYTLCVYVEYVYAYPFTLRLYIRSSLPD